MLEPQKFLVPSAEYKTRKFGFVIDETRHVPFGPNTLPHAIDMLIENIRAQRADIERLTEASHQAGDQTIAERLAEQIVDIDEVLPSLINLIAIPGTTDRKSTRLNSSHSCATRMPSSARKTTH